VSSTFWSLGYLSSCWRGLPHAGWSSCAAAGRQWRAPARLSAAINRDDVAVVSNPEFLREGTAVADFLRPERIVVGSDSADAAALVAGLYTQLDAPTVLTNTTSVELVKYAANGFLAVKLSYINGIAELCERFGADIVDVITAWRRRLPRLPSAFARQVQPGSPCGGRKEHPDHPRPRKQPVPSRLRNRYLGSVHPNPQS
jgi:hypothetical protein